MDVLAVATTVCALCKAIETWIDQIAQKELLLRQISSNVAQIRNILSPFASAQYNGKGEIQLSEAIRSVGDVLQRTREHLVAWNYKRAQKIVSFLNPSALVQQLKDDQRQISHQLIILLTSIAVVGYFRDHRSDDTTLTLVEPDLGDDGSTIRDFEAKDELVHQDAKEFWQDYIGAKVTFATNDLFSMRLRSWYGGLSSKTSDRIVMRLDEYNAGGISPYSLSRALGNTSLKEFIDHCTKGEKPLPPPDSAIKVAFGHSLRAPLLVWVDDRPENNAYEVAQAREAGIYVVELSSTAVAKAWIEANTGFLRENDDASLVRFISDNVRLEATPTAPQFLNPSAGQNLLQYLRGRYFSAPVLIYTGRSIDSTHYVNLYELAGSTTSAGTCLQYISSLAGSRNDDTSWVGFKASW
ncbi:hypothetical protein GALMADRAFT_222682 [Galerina marginata CBS 339.88]|uniref:Uncharacterized protein n=1 Tax=Galerina marginata (strain CBS 339.88) TaxID=685588 RepID=A0A067TDC8_GALM3|nr:hypothetical protein GALMADRAFT_222682 [Galerina marginata CBS 339.88]